MNDNVSFVLKSGMFATCSGIWDDRLQQYRNATSTEIADCCSQQCIKPVKFCRKYCMDNLVQEFDNKVLLDKCLKTCEDVRNICLGTCSLSSPHVGMNNNYFQCAYEFGCRGVGNYPDRECVIKNKDEIFNCCRKTCLPTKDIDCQQHCEYIQSAIIDPEKTTGVPLSQKTLNNLSNNFKMYPDDTWLYILVGISVSIILIFLWFFVTKRM